MIVVLSLSSKLSHAKINLSDYSVSYKLLAYKQFLQLIYLCILIIKPLAQSLVSVQGVRAYTIMQSHKHLLIMSYVWGQKLFWQNKLSSPDIYYRHRH